MHTRVGVLSAGIGLRSRRGRRVIRQKEVGGTDVRGDHPRRRRSAFHQFRQSRAEGFDHGGMGELEGQLMVSELDGAITLSPSLLDGLFGKGAADAPQYRVVLSDDAEHEPSDADEADADEA